MNYNLYVLKNKITENIVAIYNDYEQAENDMTFLTHETNGMYAIILYSTNDINEVRYLERGEVTC